MLPLLITPEYELTLPSTNEKIRYRPFLVKEEKILLTAMESKDQKQILNSIIQILKNCILSDINIETLSFFDFEYLFLMLRSSSIGNVVQLSLQHKCEGINDVAINLEDIKVQFDSTHNDKIMITDELGVKLKYPSISNLDTFTNLNSKNIFEVLSKSIEYVYDDNKIYDEFTKDEMIKFIESMNNTQLKKVLNFFETMPKLEHDLTYTCTKCGENVEYKLSGLQDFFT